VVPGEEGVAAGLQVLVRLEGFGVAAIAAPSTKAETSSTPASETAAGVRPEPPPAARSIGRATGPRSAISREARVAGDVGPPCYRRRRWEEGMDLDTPPAPVIPPPQTLIAWLRDGADRPTLVALLERRVWHDPSLRREIATRMRAAPGEEGLPDLRGALETILGVAAPAGGWSEGWDLVADVADLARSAVGLVGRDPRAVLAFAEYALRRLDEGEEEVGCAFEEWPGFGEALVALEELHAAACGPAGRGGPELARDLFAREIDALGEAYVGVAGRWAAALGDDGLAEYRRLAEARWAEMPAAGPGERVSYSCGPRRLAASLEWLARRDGDLDRLVGIRARDLSTPERFAGIAEECRAFGRHDLALAWIERGLAAFEGHPDRRLVELADEEYVRAGRAEEATALAFRCFATRPSLDGYRALQACAERHGAWPSWRELALDWLRNRLAEAASMPDWEARGIANVLVQVVHFEGDAEAAWRLAGEIGCSTGTWLELADARAATHPDDAVEVYRRAADGHVERKSRSGYDEAVRLLEKARDVLAAAGREGRFRAIALDFRVHHGRKSNLMRLFDERGW
jgi:hypothetical protein